MWQQLGLTAPAPLSVTALIVNLLLGAVLALVLSWHYVKFGRTFSNRAELAAVLPLIVLATILIISVVKSSLALSLGLVGALSIVRFRTPIKEPEELAYLFLAIAVGLGFGADQRVPTLVAFVVILGVVTARRMNRRKTQKQNLYLNVEVVGKEGGDSLFRKINGVLAEHVQAADMRRLDARNGRLEATYYIDCEGPDDLARLMDSLNGSLPGVGITFLEQRGIPGR